MYFLKLSAVPEFHTLGNPYLGQSVLQRKSRGEWSVRPTEKVEEVEELTTWMSGGEAL